MILYAITVFAGAFLLFQVQPIIAKLILPWFGGSAGVWTTCMVFFQAGLLLGYLYAHWIVHQFRPKWQAVIHTALLALSAICLPILPDPAWKPAGAEAPAALIFALLAVTVGLPYLLLSTTGPLIQAWYARRGHSSLPYWLFALSNLASLAGLLAYPFVIDRFVATQTQAAGWSAGYAVFAILYATAAIRSARARTEPAVAPEGPATALEDGPPGWRQLLLWMALALVPSALLLAVTNHLTQNVASVPFLWIIPLAVYLLSFILSFSSARWYSRDIYHWLLAFAVAEMTVFLWIPELGSVLRVAIPVFIAALFIACMYFHGELAHRKPHPRHLTAFYLMVALGGALGGLFVSVLAPVLFDAYFELPATLAAVVVLASALIRGRKRLTDVVWIAVTIGVLFSVFAHVGSFYRDAQAIGRNFYGSIRVTETTDPVSSAAVRGLLHGTVYHGKQFQAPGRRDAPTTYYGRDSGIGLALGQIRRSPLRVGVIGLGVGTLATYAKPGDYYRFYEINPLVAQYARQYFTFLADTAATVDVVLGDGRLSLEREAPNEFDVLVVDAFSGDSIPVHLLTREAFEAYFRHLQPNGVLAIHISNTSLDIAPVVGKVARSLGCRSLLIQSHGEAAAATMNAIWALVARDGSLLDQPVLSGVGQEIPDRPDLPVWTDDYSNLLQIIR